ncbi:uncharacterized protein EV420DRAFT_1473515 [Desarmillaria tabescens]|uniref:Uncharacterized protein n=1 Tax=Armillaria tabescens TaxID=1929756 RepID=A0AA39T7U2_ARMTA|nr:uncharacterized protein EV420DRAFT_1473515 [Desarmillaria tabescens]KAK0470456.1 hypothetical protein EV420DRAFT_1473515 [Desarmillaria tabescens]
MTRLACLKVDSLSSHLGISSPLSPGLNHTITFAQSLDDRLSTLALLILIHHPVKGGMHACCTPSALSPSRVHLPCLRRGKWFLTRRRPAVVIYRRLLEEQGVLSGSCQINDTRNLALNLHAKCFRDHRWVDPLRIFPNAGYYINLLGVSRHLERDRSYACERSRTIVWITSRWTISLHPSKYGKMIPDDRLHKAGLVNLYCACWHIYQQEGIVHPDRVIHEISAVSNPSQIKKDGEGACVSAHDEADIRSIA